MAKTGSAGPQIHRLSQSQLEELLLKLRECLEEPTYQLVASLLRTLQWIMGVLAERKIPLGRLRKMFFRSESEKTGKLFAPKEPGAQAPAPVRVEKPKRKGHGRRKSQDYKGAKRICVPHPLHRAGELCPKCSRGKLYLLKKPMELVCIMARPIFEATIYELERLRCALCQAILVAPAPASAAGGKYDPSVGTMLALLRYGAGLPMYRVEKWQEFFQVPFPSSTQWELLEAASHMPELIYDELIEQAAQGVVLHNDDTNMRVQSLRREISQDQESERTGIFTTGVVCQSVERPIALFFTGREHAGENLDQILKHRATELSKPLQMCDGLTRNLPKHSATQPCNCLVHGRRQFVDQIENFPEECRKVIEIVGQIYQVEEQIKEAGLGPAERLARHQKESGPLLEGLRQWMNDQLDQRKTEPNSGLGQAIRYMLKRWDALTRFLTLPGVPLDNNICERALKMAILHRKNSLSYKTARGAKVGDVFMSLIHTCQLNKVNPFDYLTVLQKHAEEIPQDPSRWLPWNYLQAISALESG